MSEAELLRFIHHFSRSLSCEMIVAAESATPGAMLPARCQCMRGGLKPKHIPAYRQWILYTTQMIADRWGKRLVYALGAAPNRTEFWSFEPGATPKLLNKLNCPIP